MPAVGEFVTVCAGHRILLRTQFTQERQRGAEFAARLGANENIFGPSPKAIRAMQEATSEIWKYGDPTSFDLRNALADHLGLAAENIVVGEGID